MHIALDVDSTLLKVRSEHDNAMIGLMAELTGIDTDHLAGILAGLDIHQYGYSHTDHLRIALQQANIHVADIDGLTQELDEGLRDILAADAGNILYPDTVPFLQRARDLGHTISLVTFGRYDYQIAKIEATGLHHLVDAIRVVEQKGAKPIALDEIFQELQIPGEEPAIYVDDKEFELSTMQARFDVGVGLYLIDRKQTAQGNPGGPESFQAHEQEYFQRVTTLDEISIE